MKVRLEFDYQGTNHRLRQLLDAIEGRVGVGRIKVTADGERQSWWDEIVDERERRHEEYHHHLAEQEREWQAIIDDPAAERWVVREQYAPGPIIVYILGDDRAAAETPHHSPAPMHPKRLEHLRRIGTWHKEPAVAA